MFQVLPRGGNLFRQVCCFFLIARLRGPTRSPQQKRKRRCCRTSPNFLRISTHGNRDPNSSLATYTHTFLLAEKPKGRSSLLGGLPGCGVCKWAVAARNAVTTMATTGALHRPPKHADRPGSERPMPPTPLFETGVEDRDRALRCSMPLGIEIKHIRADRRRNFDRTWAS